MKQCCVAFPQNISGEVEQDLWAGGITSACECTQKSLAGSELILSSYSMSHSGNSSTLARAARVLVARVFTAW